MGFLFVECKKECNYFCNTKVDFYLYDMIHKADQELKIKWATIFNGLTSESKTALKEALMSLRSDALLKSQYCWKKHKAPMALYWKVVGVYAGHLARSIK